MKTNGNITDIGEYNRTTRLSAYEMQHPIQVVEDFFINYDLLHFRKLLWQWFKAVVISPEFGAEESHQKDNHTHFYEKLEALVEAVYLLKTNAQQSVTQ